MKINLAYGQTGLAVELPDEGATVIEPHYVPGLSNESEALRQALRSPIDKPPLRELVRAEQTVAITVCDITRPMPSARVLPVLLEELAHVPREQIAIIIATGTHRANTPEELERMLGREVVRDYQIINHSAFDQETLKDLGQTPNGIPIRLNRRWVESDVRITTGFVEPHFFAGFSGGPKMVAPGMAAFETIFQLHNAPLIGHPNATWGITEGNPIHDAIRQIARQTGVDFSVDVIINRDHQITSVFAGELFAAHAAACRSAKRTAMRAVNEPFDVVITTNSGYPLDMNLYQAVKGMSAAARVVRDGGTIICAAECADGLPEHGEYKQILASARSPQELLSQINSPGYARHDQWTVQVQAQIQMRAKVLLKSSYLSAEQVRAAHLEPVENIEEALKEVMRKKGAQTRICALPQGPQTIPYVERG